MQGAPQSTEEHYLKRELYQRVRTDPSIFEFLQEGSLDGVWYWDLENPSEEWLSPRFKGLFGYADDEVPDKVGWWQEKIHPDDLKVALDNLEKHRADPSHPYDQVVRYWHKDGSVMWVRCRGIAIRNDKGKAIRMLGSHTDLTDLMRAEAALKDKADLLQLLHRLAATANEAVMLDTQLNVKLFTPETENLLRLTMADIGHPLRSLVGNRNDSGLLDDAQEVLDTLATIEKKMLTDDGRCYIRRTVPLFSPDNKVDGVVIAFVDITQHARDEAAVRVSEQRLTYATEATGAVVWDRDQSADTCWWSEEHTNLFGEQPPDTQNAWQWWADHVHSDDRRRVLDSIDTAINSDNAHWACEYQYQRADGTFAKVLDKAHLARDENGKAVRIIGALQDITEQKKAEQKLRRTERLVSVGTLATGLIHEIYNPLAALQIAAQAALNMKDKGDADGKLEKSLRNVVESAGRCDEIVKNLRRFVGGQNSDRESRDLNEIISHAVESTSAFCESHNVRIKWTARQDLPSMTMNCLEIELLLVNLIHNAAQACEAGGQIKIETNPSPSSVRLTVRDNGCGISEKAAQHAFEPFYSTRHGEGGMGLGLSIAYGIVVDHGGSIHIDGRSGTGTTVAVELPTVERDVA